jgi:VWFA-related protein
MGAELPRILIALVTFALAQPPAPDAQPPAPDGQPPAFKTGVNAVEVDVVVTDRDGHLVRGLSRDDFEVFEDGKPVAIATFSAVDAPAAPVDAPTAAAHQSGTGIGSNAFPFDGRVILIVLDDYHVSFDAGRSEAAKRAARRAVERLGPADLAAVLTTSGRRVSQAEFTADKARLIAAIDTFFPQSERAAPGVAGRASPGPGRGGGFGFVEELKARQAMGALSNAAKALAEIPHRRKAILLVSQGLPLGLEEAITSPAGGAAAESLRDFITIAQRSNVAVYPVDPCALERDDGCSRESQDNLRSVAEGTGGFAVLNTNAPERGVDRMIEENGTYYLLGYYSPAPPNDGRRHRIRVTVRRPGVEVRAREGYVSPRRAAPRAAPPETLEALVAAPIQTRGLDMRVAAVPAPIAASPGSTVVLGVELRAGAALGARDVEFLIVAVDAGGRVRQRQRFSTSFTMNLPAGATGLPAEAGSHAGGLPAEAGRHAGGLPAEAGRHAGGLRAEAGSHAGGAGEWVRFASRMNLGDGRYQIRLAARAAQGRPGSVFVEVDVPKFDGDLAAGGLSLGPPPSQRVARVDKLGGPLPIAPLPGIEPLTVANAVVQLPVRVGRRVAGPVTIAATLVGPDGARREITTAALAASDFSDGDGGTFRVPLPPLSAPGRYRVVVEVSAGRSRLTRELPFAVGAP